LVASLEVLACSRSPPSGLRSVGLASRLAPPVGIDPQVSYKMFKSPNSYGRYDANMTARCALASVNTT
jgi:hypothetical protein